MSEARAIGGCLLAAALAGLSGCNHMVNGGSNAGLISRNPADPGTAYTVPTRPLVPNASLHLTPTRAIALESLLAGAAVYYFVDPLAPNWEGEIRRVTDDTFSIALRSKRFRSTGGDGEAGRVFRRNADRVVRQGGFSGYSIESYSEGIESETLGAVRVSEGVIRVTSR